MAVNAPDYEPTPDEIAAGCVEIQARWSPEERYRRSVSFAESANRAASSYQPEPYTVPVIRAADLPDALAG